MSCSVRVLQSLELVWDLTYCLPIQDLIEEGKSRHQPALLERAPLQLLEQTSDAHITRMLTGDKACGFSLHCFKAFDVVLMVGIPRAGCILQDWADHCPVCHVLSASGASIQVTSEEVKGALSFGYDLAEVWPPAKIT